MTKRKCWHDPAGLAPDDEAVNEPPFNLHFREQNDAFLLAMRKAVKRGLERSGIEGIKTADPNDTRVLRTTPRAATYVPSMSSLSVR